MAGRLGDPAVHAAYYQYRWASDRARALSVCARDVPRLARAFPELFAQGAVRLYKHKAWPCVYVTLVATVVAVRVREAHMEYTVDDGSAAIDVQCAHVVRDAPPQGVYSCYVRTDALRDAPRRHVGDVVRLTGRVFERRDASRALEVEEMACVDATQEPLHVLQALAWSAERYGMAPPLPRVCDAEAAGAAEHETPPSLLPLPALPPPPSTRGMVAFLYTYLQDKTRAVLGDVPRLTRAAMPLFTIPQLLASARVQHHALRLITHKLGGRAISDAARVAKTERLVVHCLACLVRAGAVLERARVHGFQMVCPELLAAYVAALVEHTPRPQPAHRAEAVHAFAAGAMRHRLCRADPRLTRVPTPVWDAALALLAQRGVVARMDAEVWRVLP